MSSSFGGNDGGGGGGGGVVLGVEIVSGVVDMAKQCISANGFVHDVSVVRNDGHALCRHAAELPAEQRPLAPLLIAELMDSGGLGEGLLPLAADAVASGLLAPDAKLMPCRLRVYAFAAELRAGTHRWPRTADC